MILKVIVVKIRSSFLLAWIYGYGCDVQVEKFWKVKSPHDRESGFPRKGENLHSKWSTLDWSVFAADIFGNLGHGFVVGQPLWVLQLIQVLDDPVRIG